MIQSNSRRSLSRAIRKAGLPPLTARPGTIASLHELSEVYMQLLILGIDHRHAGTEQLHTKIGQTAVLYPHFAALASQLPGHAQDPLVKFAGPLFKMSAKRIRRDLALLGSLDSMAVS